MIPRPDGSPEMGCGCLPYEDHSNRGALRGPSMLVPCPSGSCTYSSRPVTTPIGVRRGSRAFLHEVMANRLFSERVLRRVTEQPTPTDSNYHDVETGEEYWISGRNAISPTHVTAPRSHRSRTTSKRTTRRFCADPRYRAANAGNPESPRVASRGESAFLEPDPIFGGVGEHPAVIAGRPGVPPARGRFGPGHCPIKPAGPQLIGDLPRQGHRYCMVAHPEGIRSGSGIENTSLRRRWTSAVPIGMGARHFLACPREIQVLQPRSRGNPGLPQFVTGERISPSSRQPITAGFLPGSAVLIPES